MPSSWNTVGTGWGSCRPVGGGIARERRTRSSNKFHIFGWCLWVVVWVWGFCGVGGCRGCVFCCCVVLVIRLGLIDYPEQPLGRRGLPPLLGGSANTVALMFAGSLILKEMVHPFGLYHRIPIAGRVDIARPYHSCRTV